MVDVVIGPPFWGLVILFLLKIEWGSLRRPHILTTQQQMTPLVDRHAPQRDSPVRQNNLPFSPPASRPDGACIFQGTGARVQIRDWTLITGRGGGVQNGRAGQVKFYPYKKGGKQSFVPAISPFCRPPPHN